jgi:hypothetical protein
MHDCTHVTGLWSFTRQRHCQHNYVVFFNHRLELVSWLLHIRPSGDFPSGEMR